MLQSCLRTMSHDGRQEIFTSTGEHGPDLKMIFAKARARRCKRRSPTWVTRPVHRRSMQPCGDASTFADGFLVPQHCNPLLFQMRPQAWANLLFEVLRGRAPPGEHEQRYEQQL